MCGITTIRVVSTGGLVLKLHSRVELKVASLHLFLRSDNASYIQRSQKRWKARCTGPWEFSLSGCFFILAVTYIQQQTSAAGSDVPCPQGVYRKASGLGVSDTELLV